MCLICPSDPQGVSANFFLFRDIEIVHKSTSDYKNTIFLIFYHILLVKGRIVVIKDKKKKLKKCINK